MTTMGHYHDVGQSVQDAIALTAASAGPVDHPAVLAIIREMAVDGGGPRLAAALEILAGLASGFLESWADATGNPASGLLQEFALVAARRYVDPQ